MYIVKVTGQYYVGDNSPEPTIADMLRYDDGEMIEWKGSDIEGLKSRRTFEAEIHSNSFTPDRWRSFGLRAVLVSKEPGKAHCNYPDMASVYKVIHAHGH